MAASPWQDIEVTAEEFAAEVASRLETEGQARPEAPEGLEAPESLAALRATGREDGSPGSSGRPPGTIGATTSGHSPAWLA